MNRRGFLQRLVGGAAAVAGWRVFQLDGREQTHLVVTDPKAIIDPATGDRIYRVRVRMVYDHTSWRGVYGTTGDV